MKFDINKFLKNRDVYCNKMAPKGIFGFLWLIAIGFGGILLDVEHLFGLSFDYLIAFCGFIFTLSFGFVLTWVIYLFYYAIVSRIYAKKFPEYKEVLLNEDK